MQLEHRRALEELRREYRIDFKNDIPAAQWPRNYRAAFKAIQDLGRIRHAEYGKDCGPEASEQQWKHRAKILAKKLTEKAEQCLRRNEASWRFACEPLVFTQFSAEVACPNCRKRVWRSEIEVSPNTEDRRPGTLSKRQQNREPCRCPRDTRPQDSDEVVGLNKIFIDRAQDSVLHSPQLTKKLPKREHPDRVYGLRQTRNFENFLYAQHKDGKLVRELLPSGPFSDDGHPILFPFLVIEAKSGKSAADWHTIKLQTAFPIYTFLEAQQSIRRATGSRSKWQAGPLVWFFMSKGEDWRLCVAYPVDCGCGNPLHRNSVTLITELWKGSIESIDGALQLILIVDYICDWARDIYRPAVLTELKTLSLPDNVDIKTEPDSDIYSLRDISSNNTDEGGSGLSGSGRSNGHGALKLLAEFRTFDSSNGIVRHASPIESRFSALFITRDSVKTLLLSIPENIVKHFSRQIIGIIHRKSLMLMSEQLDKIEKIWTGHNRISIPFNLAQTMFYSVITITSYMTVQWEQVRELAIIAVAEDAFDLLVAESGLKLGWGKAKKPFVHEVDRDLVVSTISHLKDGSIRHNLLAAITRIAFYVNPDHFNWERLRLYRDDGITWELVNHAYKQLKRGRLEPAEPSLRISTQMDFQSINNSCAGPFDLTENLEVSPSHVVLLHGEGPFHNVGKKMQSPLCVYLVGEKLGLPDQNSLVAIIKDTFEDFDVYHTTRDNGKMSLKEKKGGRVPWNLSDSYGVHFSCGDSSFLKWLQSLNAAIPTRQGSPRGPLVGGNMLQRRYTPWHDRRIIHGAPYDKVKLKFLQRLVTLEYSIWGDIARQRRDVGIRCCFCCATILGDSHQRDALCGNCESKLDSPRYPKWFGEQMKKNLPQSTRTVIRDPFPNREPPIKYNTGTPEARLSPSFYKRTEKMVDSKSGFYSDSSPSDEVQSDSDVSTTDWIPRVSPAPVGGPGEASSSSTPGISSRKRKRPD